jgi:PKD repeat protein
MMENESYNHVVGSPNAPFETSLAGQCGVAASNFAATHTSAANYLAASAGAYPPSSPPGCGSVRACLDPSDNLYSQLTRPGLTWGAFEEGMPTPCAPSSSGTNTSAHDLYSNGHNPPIFFSAISAADCRAHDLGVPDLTAQSGAFWDDLQNQTLPSFSFITPSAADDSEGPGTPAHAQQVADTWLQHFVAAVSQSASYQAGNTLVLIDYDEGTNGPDSTVNEDCTDPTLDLPIVNGVSAAHESCHVPLFVVYPYTTTGDHESTFFDTYSITRTVEQLFGLPYLAHAGDARTTSLVGSFGIPAASAQPPPPPLGTGPIPNATSSCTFLTCAFDGSTSTDDTGSVVSYAWTFGDGTTGTGVNPSHSYQSPGTYAYTLAVTDDAGAQSTNDFNGSVTVAVAPPPPPPPPAPAPIAFRAAAHNYANGATPNSGVSLTEPATIAAGDTELLFVSSAAVGATADPAGWTKLSQQTAAPLQSILYTRTATATDARSVVRVPITANDKVSLELSAYSGAASPVGATGSIDSSKVTHVALAAAVTTPNSWVLNYWSDRSSTTTDWTLPAAVTDRDMVIGQGGGHPSAAIADSGGALPTGTYPAGAAQVVGGASGKGASFTVVLTPGG